MKMVWYVARDGVQYGPYSDEAFRKYVEGGNVSLDDYVINSTMTNWILFRELKLHSSQRQEVVNRHPYESNTSAAVVPRETETKENFKKAPKKHKVSKRILALIILIAVIYIFKDPLLKIVERFSDDNSITNESCDISYDEYEIKRNEALENEAKEREKEITDMQDAFMNKDTQQISQFLHPAVKKKFMEAFENHKDELDRVGKMIETRKLIFQSSDYAEYEVQDGNEVFTIIFEKVGDKWNLSRF